MIFIDAINVKIRDGQVAKRPIYLALGVTAGGERDVLGLWAGEHSDGEGHLAVSDIDPPRRAPARTPASHPSTRGPGPRSSTAWPTGKRWHRQPAPARHPGEKAIGPR